MTWQQTYTGSILIAINPFQKLPHLYDRHMMEQYKGAPLGELSPHVFAIADAAYRYSCFNFHSTWFTPKHYTIVTKIIKWIRQMINEGKSNSILVSGESGAGKTETTKMLMQYLAYLGGRRSTEGRTVEQQVLEVDYIILMSRALFKLFFSLNLQG